MNPVRKVNAFWQQLCTALGSSQPPALLPYGLGCPVLAFLAHRTAQAEGFGGNRYQIKHRAGNFLASLNTEIQMKFHLKTFCKLCGKMRGALVQYILAVHGKVFRVFFCASKDHDVLRTDNFTLY